MARRPMPISSRWFQGAVLTSLIGFTVPGVLAYLVYRDQPPLPANVVAGDKVLFTRNDIFGAMNVFTRVIAVVGPYHGRLLAGAIPRIGIAPLHRCRFNFRYSPMSIAVG